VSLANNDYNWRLVAAADLAENITVHVSTAGKAEVATGQNVMGIVPQAVKAGERAPVIRGGKLGGLTGFSAGAKLRGQADGTLGTGGANPIYAIVVSEDAATAVICSGNLDQNV